MKYFCEKKRIYFEQETYSIVFKQVELLLVLSNPLQITKKYLPLFSIMGRYSL